MHRWGIDLARECLFLVPVPSYASFLFKLSILDPCPTLSAAKNIKKFDFSYPIKFLSIKLRRLLFFNIISILNMNFTIFKDINLEKLSICYNIKYFSIEFWLEKKIHLYISVCSYFIKKIITLISRQKIRKLFHKKQV